MTPAARIAYLRRLIATREGHFVWRQSVILAKRELAELEKTDAHASDA